MSQSISQPPGRLEPVGDATASQSTSEPSLPDASPTEGGSCSNQLQACLSLDRLDPASGVTASQMTSDSPLPDTFLAEAGSSLDQPRATSCQPSVGALPSQNATASESTRSLPLPNKHPARKISSSIQAQASFSQSVQSLPPSSTFENQYSPCMPPANLSSGTSELSGPVLLSGEAQVSPSAQTEPAFPAEAESFHTAQGRVSSTQSVRSQRPQSTNMNRQAVHFDSSALPGLNLPSAPRTDDSTRPGPCSGQGPTVPSLHTAGVGPSSATVGSSCMRKRISSALRPRPVSMYCPLTSSDFASTLPSASGSSEFGPAQAPQRSSSTQRLLQRLSFSGSRHSLSIAPSTPAILLVSTIGEHVPTTPLSQDPAFTFLSPGQSEVPLASPASPTLVSSDQLARPIPTANRSSSHYSQEEWDFPGVEQPSEGPAPSLGPLSSSLVSPPLNPRASTARQSQSTRPPEILVPSSAAAESSLLQPRTLMPPVAISRGPTDTPEYSSDMPNTRSMYSLDQYGGSQAEMASNPQPAQSSQDVSIAQPAPSGIPPFKKSSKGWFNSWPSKVRISNSNNTSLSSFPNFGLRRSKSIVPAGRGIGAADNGNGVTNAADAPESRRSAERGRSRAHAHDATTSTPSTVRPSTQGIHGSIAERNLGGHHIPRDRLGPLDSGHGSQSLTSRERPYNTAAQAVARAEKVIAQAKVLQELSDHSERARRLLQSEDVIAIQRYLAENPSCLRPGR